MIGAGSFHDYLSSGLVFTQGLLEKAGNGEYSR
jgi:hypothetical protein